MSTDMSIVGMPVTELASPSLLIDLPAMERDIAKTVAPLNDAGVTWRPHAKGHYLTSVALGRHGRHDLSYLRLISGRLAAMSYNCILNSKGMLLDRGRGLVLYGRESRPTLPDRPK